MKEIILFFGLVLSFAVFADGPTVVVQPATQPSAQVSMGPSSQDTQQINSFFDKADYKSLKRYKFKSLFKVPSHD